MTTFFIPHIVTGMRFQWKPPNGVCCRVHCRCSSFYNNEQAKDKNTMVCAYCGCIKKEPVMYRCPNCHHETGYQPFTNSIGTKFL